MYKDKILNVETLLTWVDQWRSIQDKIVFTNGCFDLLHLGHVEYLSQAKRLGDRLIVGLNSDHSIRVNKGPYRPIQHEISRAGVLAGLASVDAVILFSDTTPIKLIESILPDVLVKGGDYQKSNVVGASEVEANGGNVVIIPFLIGYSTSSIIEKIKNQG
jgi:rfaE bifunctional protein nucleotidyltransferase chain/domain